jgi:hypothetical protein
MAHGLIAAGGTGVVFVATMPMRPAVVTGERGLCGPYPSHQICWSHRRYPPPFALAAASTNFLLVAVTVVTVVVRSRLAAVSCWRMAMLFVTARAQLLSAVLSRLNVGAASGSTPCAQPRGSPPP